MATTDVLVIGAGMSGLMAASALQRAGRTVQVVDKGRGVGGRMATRRLGEAVFDHGAQFFTAEDARFHPWIETWTAEGVVQEWGTGFQGENGHHQLARPTRYVGAGGMTSIPKHLAAGLDVQTGTRITSLARRSDGWLAVGHEGDSFAARSLVVTCPVPQATILLRSLPEHDAAFVESLGRVAYAPCLVLLATLDGPSGLPRPGGLRLRNQMLFWIGDNQAKGISPRAHAVTIQANPEFSLRFYDHGPEGAARQIRDLAQTLLSSRIVSTQLKKWRYATVTEGWDAPMAVVPGEQAPLVLAGDAFGGPCVEGAALSGLAAAEWLDTNLH